MTILNRPSVAVMLATSAGKLSATASGFSAQNLQNAKNDGTDWQILAPDGSTAQSLTMNDSSITYNVNAYGTWTVKARFHATGTDLNGNPFSGYGEWGSATAATGAAPVPVISTPSVSASIS